MNTTKPAAMFPPQRERPAPLFVKSAMHRTAGTPATPSDAQQEECTCETLCTEGRSQCGLSRLLCGGCGFICLQRSCFHAAGCSTECRKHSLSGREWNTTNRCSATQVTNSDTQWTNGWYVAQGDITIDQPVTVSDNVYLILEDGCNLTVNGGILLTKGSNMYIYAQSTEKETMGSLTANGTDAGIKEANYGTPTLTIAGGKITADRQQHRNLRRFPYYYGWLCKCLGKRILW